MFDKYKQVIIFDVETNGLEFKTRQIIEFGGIVLENINASTMVSPGDGGDSYPANAKFEPKEYIDMLINCKEPLEEKIVELTGITDKELVEKGVHETELFLKLKPLINKDTLMIAYNSQFDMSFLYYLYQRHNEELPLVDMLDVYAIFKDRNNYPHKLSDAINTYQVVGENNHRALDDSKATLGVLKKMIAQNRNVDKYVNNVSYSGKYGLSGYRFPQVNYIPFYYKQKTISRTFDKDE